MNSTEIELFFTSPDARKTKIFEHIIKLCSTDRKILFNILADYIEILPEEVADAFLEIPLEEEEDEA